MAAFLTDVAGTGSSFSCEIICGHKTEEHFGNVAETKIWGQQ